MKKITRTIKGFEINYVEVDTNTMSMERKTEYSDTPITESAFNKSVKERGKLAADIEIKPYNNGMIEMTMLDFFTEAEIIEKKSDISGRSVTKEIHYKTSTAVVAIKRADGWKIETEMVLMFDGEFSSSDYNEVGRKMILDLGDWSEEKTVLMGMTESRFVEIGHELVK